MASFVLSIDDAGLGENVVSLTRSCRFLESRGLRATWFVVPRPEGNLLSDPWREGLLEAREAGHDLVIAMNGPQVRLFQPISRLPAGPFRTLFG